MIESFSRLASRVSALPGLSLISPAAAINPSAEDRAGFLRCQDLAQAAVAEVSSFIQDGWTENQAASLLNTYLKDCGVRSFFHRAFVWFGDRTRFEGVRTYDQYLPSSRVLLPGEVYILDVAPIYQGYTCDIGFTSCLGENPAWSRAKGFLEELRAEIPAWFLESKSGAEIWDRIDKRVQAAGYENIHSKYPFAVVGHRVHRSVGGFGGIGLLNFGWQSYWGVLSRGLFGQLLNRDYSGDLRGIWAIEPHLGVKGGFGAKFEELLVVTDNQAYWLADQEDECSLEKRS